MSTNREDVDEVSAEEIAAANRLREGLHHFLLTVDADQYVTMSALNTVVAEILLAITEGDVAQACKHAKFFGRETQRIIRSRMKDRQ